ncbi:NAD(P)/FAD-dependent oxidoreductase [Elusimicrobiota bacterium]
MIKEIELSVDPRNIHNKTHYKNEAAKKLNLSPHDIDSVVVTKRSLDARHFPPVYRLKLTVFSGEKPPGMSWSPLYKNVSVKKPVTIIGCGPAGLFAALRCIELGKKPVIYERGKEVEKRSFDIKVLLETGNLNPESNFCFGEGGAGAYSDGKLYTRSKKRGPVSEIFNTLVYHGASEDILIDSRPHMGSDMLPGVIRKMRATILNNGGEIHFNSRLTGINTKDRKVTGIIINRNIEYECKKLILATGHSARDVFELLYKSGIAIKAKPFAVGVRIEHPQYLIDKMQYNCASENLSDLPPAVYSLNNQAEGRGIYSFCMCPGGSVIPSVTEEGYLALNGMSTSSRNSSFANAGIVVSVFPEDYDKNEDNPLAGMEFQRELEKTAFNSAGKGYLAPAQRMTDYVENKDSIELPLSSYHPGIKSSLLNEILPGFIDSRLKETFRVFSRRIPAFYSREALVMAIESRTSSPVQISRDRSTCMHVAIDGLFPSGEGAGYAGGIVSSAIDGRKCAENAATL